MKVSKLSTDDYIDFGLIGLVSTVKEYKLVWHINRITHFELEKRKDIQIDFSNNIRIAVSNFSYQTQHLCVEMLKNRLLQANNRAYQYLLEEIKQFDYLIKYKDESEQTDIKDVLSLLKSINQIEYAAILEPANIKYRDNLIF